MANPYAKYAQPAANPYAVYSTPPQGPKPPSGFQASGGGMAYTPGGPSDPAQIAAEAAARARAAAAASTPIEVGGQIAAARARGQVEMEVARQKLALDRSVGPQLTAKERTDALAGYKSAQGLRRMVEDMKARYAQGPGATSGIAGLQDYLPTTANQRFDASGNSARGLVGQALGFTGGQLNTATEAAQAVGPFLPQSGNRDAVILDKIARLEALAGDAEERSISQLGGVPDASGHIKPIPAVTPPAQPGASPPPPSAGGKGDGSAIYGGGGGGGPLTPSTDGFRTEQNPLRTGVNARVNAMLRRGDSDAAVQAYLADVGAPGVANDALAFRRKNPQYRGDYTVDLETRRVPMSAGAQALNAVGNSPVGAYFTSAADAMTAGTLDNMTANPAQARAAMEGMRQQNPWSSTLGAITGAAGMAGGLEMGLGAAAARTGMGAAGRLLASPITADALYGGAYGAGSADEGSRLTGAAIGAGAGVGGGMFGRGASRAAGRAFSGIRASVDVQYLRDAGIPMTVGQQAGGRLKGFEDWLGGYPLAGGQVKQRYRESLAALRPAAAREAIGGIPGAITSQDGRQAVQQGRAAVTDAYKSGLGGVRLIPDSDFETEMRAALQGAGNLPAPLRDTFYSTVKNRVVPQFEGGMDGRNLQGSIQGLRKDAGALLRRNEVQADLFKDRTGNVEEALFNLAERQAPGTKDALSAANQANRKLGIVEAASRRAYNQGGDFTPAQLGMEIRANSNRFNTNGALDAGRAPLQRLQEAAQNVLPSSIPDTGSGGRAIAGLVAPAVLGGLAGAGGGYAAGGDTSSAGFGALGMAGVLAAGGSKVGQKALTKLLMDRPDRFVRIGDRIYERAKIGGMFGAGAGIDIASLLTGP